MSDRRQTLGVESPSCQGITVHLANPSFSHYFANSLMDIGKKYL